MEGTPDVGAAFDAGAVATPDTTISPTESASESVTSPAAADDLAELAQMLEGDPRKEAFLQRLTSQRENLSQRHQQELAEIQERFRQYDGIDPWLTPMQQLAEMGFTPELLQQQAQAFQARLQGQPGLPGQGQQPSTDPFADWLTKNGSDPNYMTDNELFLARRLFDTEQKWGEFDRQRQQSEQASVEREFNAEMTAVKTQLPIFNDPALNMALNGVYANMDDPNVSLMQVAQKLNAAIQGLTRNELARTAAAKQEDNAVPVVAGGSTPAPVERPNYHTLKPNQQAQARESWFQAHGM